MSDHVVELKMVMMQGNVTDEQEMLTALELGVRQPVTVCPQCGDEQSRGLL